MMEDINNLQGTAGSSISLNFTSFEIGDDANCYNDFIEVKKNIRTNFRRTKE